MRKIALRGEGRWAFRREVTEWLAPGEPFYLAAHCTPATLSWALELAGDRVRGLEWVYYGPEKLPRVSLPPSLTTLRVCFPNRSELGFVMTALEQCPLLQDLTLSDYADGNDKAFFAALGRSAVTRLALVSTIGDELVAYLQRDTLTELSAHSFLQPDKTLLLEALKDCTKLKILLLRGCLVTTSLLMNLPRSLTKLSLRFGQFAPDVDWSFLARSLVTDLELGVLYELDGRALYQALAARLERGPMERLCVNDTDILHRIPFHRIGKLEVVRTVSVEFVRAITAAFLLPDSHLRELSFWGGDAIFKAHLEPALRDPRCSLTKLTLHGDFKRVASRFNKRVRLLVLLQGQQVKRLRSPLRRLPVEMLRLVGEL